MLLFDNLKPVSQFILFIITILTTWVIFSLIGLIPALFIWGSDFLSNSDLIFENITFLKFYQIVNSFGLFLIPPILFAYITFKNPFSWLKLNYKSTYIIIIYAIIISVIAQPLINFLGVFNGKMEFNDFFKGLGDWIYQREQEAQYSTELFLRGSGFLHLTINIIIIAILPALGEELLFRGALQNIFTRIFNSQHISIWITAILFSAMHLQFMGFLPRFMLGLIFGYLVLYSGSLWPSITAHFSNNLMAFIIYQINIKDSDISNILEPGEEYPQLIWLVLSIIGIAFILYRININSKQIKKINLMNTSTKND